MIRLYSSGLVSFSDLSRHFFTNAEIDGCPIMRPLNQSSPSQLPVSWDFHHGMNKLLTRSGNPRGAVCQKLDRDQFNELMVYTEPFSLRGDLVRGIAASYGANA
jgi:hypothetical protein